MQYGDLEKMVQVLDLAELANVLRSTGSKFTVFAPVDEAFANLTQENINYLLSNPDKLKELLLYHILSGEKTTTAFQNGKEFQTLQGKELKVNLTKDGVIVADAHILTADILGINGVIHTIDKVLKPIVSERVTFKEPKKN